MRAIFLSLSTAVLLAACIEVEMTVEVLGEDEAQLTGFVQMHRDFYEMTGGNSSVCTDVDGARLELTDTHMRCVLDKTGSFEEVMLVNQSDDVDVEFPEMLVHLGGDRVRALFAKGGSEDELDQITDDPMTRAMMRQMFTGMSVSLTVKGREIESSTGTISEDGTSATVTFGVDDILAPAEDRIEDFETILRF